MKENYLTATQVMEQLNISRPTLHRWMNEKKLPYYKLGRKTLYKPEDVAELIKFGVSEQNLRDAELDEETLSELLNRIEANRGRPAISHDEVKKTLTELLENLRKSNDQANRASA